jgi:electron transfer flavoprotein alpha subunit
VSVLVLVEHAGGAADDVSRQALTLAGGYAEAAGGPVEAVLIGADAASAAAGLGEHGVATAHVAVHDGLAAYAPQAWGRAVAELIERLAPAAVIAPPRRWRMPPRSPACRWPPTASRPPRVTRPRSRGCAGAGA